MTTNPAAINREKSHCPGGHPYSPENTYRVCGRRYCRTCRRMRDRQRPRRPVDSEAWVKQWVPGNRYDEKERTPLNFNTTA